MEAKFKMSKQTQEIINCMVELKKVIGDFTTVSDEMYAECATELIADVYEAYNRLKEKMGTHLISSIYSNLEDSGDGVI